MSAVAMSCLVPLASVSEASEPTIRLSAGPTQGFVQSVGVNIHASYSDTSYSDADRLVRLVDDLGVQHVRDGLKANRPDATRLMRRLAELGVKASYVVGDPMNRYGAPTPDQAVALLTGGLSGTFDLLQGANEYDCSGDAAWMEATKSLQATLRQKLRAEPALASTPLLTPSFCRASSRSQYGAEPNADIGNMHPYPGGRMPESGIQAEIAATRALTGSKPMVASETGYHNATAGGASGHPGVTEQTAATYLLRLFLENHRLGIARTYAYELLDQRTDPGRTDMERNFGLVRADGTVKPAYTALQNLLAITADPGTGAATEMSVSVLGTPTSTVRTLLLDRQEGVDLIAWNAVDSETTTTVPLRLTTDRPAEARVANPVSSTDFTPLGITQELVVDVTAKPQVIRLSSPRVSVPPMTTTPSPTTPPASGTTPPTTTAPPPPTATPPTTTPSPTITPAPAQAFTAWLISRLTRGGFPVLKGVATRLLRVAAERGKEARRAPTSTVRRVR